MITLDDVVVILKIPVTGSSVSVSYLIANKAHDLLCRLLRVSIVVATRQIKEIRGPYVKLDWLKKMFMNVQFQLLTKRSTMSVGRTCYIY